MDTIKIDRRMKKKVNKLFESIVRCQTLSIEYDGGYDQNHGYVQEDENCLDMEWLKKKFWDLRFAKIYHGWAADRRIFTIYFHSNNSYDVKVSEEFLNSLKN